MHILRQKFRFPTIPINTPLGRRTSLPSLTFCRKTKVRPSFRHLKKGIGAINAGCSSNGDHPNDIVTRTDWLGGAPLLFPREKRSPNGDKAINHPVVFTTGLFKVDCRLSASVR